MAHFAKLDSNNIVTEIIVVNNDVLLTTNNTESELKGKQFLNATFGSATWVQSSINSSFRKNHATVGSTYDQQKDAFIYPKPFDSWTLNLTTCRWESPIPYPTDGEIYSWNEETISWDLITE